jgi:hypothetical protein
MNYEGSCHCGRIKFEAEGTIDSALSCNCSICRRKGSLLWFVPASAFRLLTPETDASTYRFNKMHIAHRFCAYCGVAPFGQGTDPKGNAMVAVNLRCVPAVDLKALKVIEYDGASL